MKCDKCGRVLHKGVTECPSCNFVVEKVAVEDTTKVKNFSWITELVSKVGSVPVHYPKNMATTVYGIPPISSRVSEKVDYERITEEKLCGYCKSKIKLDDMVCPKCGKKLGFAALFDNCEDEQDE